MPNKFPHMMPEDLPVWQGFLAQGGIEGAQYTYDVKVGTPIQTLGDMPEPFRSNCEMLSMKRIDVIAETPEAIFIIEVKDEAGWSAIGQAIGYDLLYNRDVKPDKPTAPLIVARCIPADVRFILESRDIPYIQVDQLVYDDEPAPTPEPNAA